MRILLSLCFLLAFASVWVWDSVVQLRGEPRNSVSATLLEWSMIYPVIPFGVGVVIGHLFWPQTIHRP